MPTCGRTAIRRRSIPGRSFSSWCRADRTRCTIAWTYRYLGAHGQAAAADARTLLQRAGWRTAVAPPFLVLVAHLGNRQAGLEADARAVLDDAARNCDTNASPYPVIAYMRRDLSPEALVAAASNNDRKTEAHTYPGMELLLRDRVADAREHFIWVKDVPSSSRSHLLLQ
jgi:hypothetical protein